MIVLVRQSDSEKQRCLTDIKWITFVNSLFLAVNAATILPLFTKHSVVVKHTGWPQKVSRRLLSIFAKYLPIFNFLSPPHYAENL